jgi:hypothetical protein
MNPRPDNNEAAVKWEDNALDVRSGVEFLRRQPGITKVLLFGHSGGGPAMAQAREALSAHDFIKRPAPISAFSDQRRTKSTI